MSAVIPSAPTSQPVFAGEQHIIFRHSSWATYQRLLREREGSRPRLTYNRGVLEIMTTGLQHEKLVRLFEALINILALSFGIDIESAGETTYQRADLQRGFEPDGSYYFTNIATIRAKERLDLAVDPAPDLVIEIDLSSSSLDKQPIMAALGIQELWRYQADSVAILRLSGEKYRLADDSGCFPGVTSDMLNTWIAAGQTSARPAWLQKIQHEAGRRS